MNKLRRIRPVVLLIGLAIVTALLLFLSVNFSFIGKKSIHEDAKSYQTRHCLVFYPDSSEGLKYAKQICKGVKDDRIYDYALTPYGDYYQVNYGGEYRYFADKEFNSVSITDVGDEGRKIVVDYLRYAFKKEDPEKYYDPSFIKGLNADAIDFSKVTYELQGEYLICHMSEFGKDVSVPIKYLQKPLGMDFGFADEMYRKPVYIDDSPEHPVICLTFDDGPVFWYDKGETSTEKIIDTLYEYDACGTFYMVGTNIENRAVWADYQAYAFFKKAVNQGNEFGSHTQTHKYTLTELDYSDEIYDEINGPIEYMKEFFDYDMKTYRPVSGEFNEDVLNSQPVGAVLWDVDSEDWLSQDPDSIYDRVVNVDYESGDIVIFHDIYDETAEALERILPELIRKGVQFVTVSDLLNYYDIDIDKLRYFYSPGYYE